MLFSIQVYARSHGPLDLALLRGIEAYEAARALGNSSLEVYAAGGVALTYAMLGQVPEAETWLDKAGSAALVTQDALPERQLEMWRGEVRAAADDAAGMRRHLERALALATDRGSPAGRCEVLALLATHAGAAGRGPGRRRSPLACGGGGPTRRSAWRRRSRRRTRGSRPRRTPLSRRSRSPAGTRSRRSSTRSLRSPSSDGSGSSSPSCTPTRDCWSLARPRDVDDPHVAEFRMQMRGDVIVALVPDGRRFGPRALAQHAGDDRADDARRSGNEAIRMLPSGAAVPAGLTTEEADLLRRVMAGQTNKEIAAAVGTRRARRLPAKSHGSSHRSARRPAAERPPRRCERGSCDAAGRRRPPAMHRRRDLHLPRADGVPVA